MKNGISVITLLLLTSYICLALVFKMSQLDSVRIIETKDSNAICCLRLPNFLLDEWYSSGDATPYAVRLSKCIVGRSMTINNCTSVENRLSYRAYSKIKSATRKHIEKVNAQYSIFTIYKDEVMQPPLSLLRQDFRSVKLQLTKMTIIIIHTSTDLS